MQVPRQLSPHFNEREFGRGPMSETQRWLARELCVRCLEPIRAIVGTPIYLTDGVRTWDEHQDLERRGYSPYILSDHSYMLEWNPYGVGAADCLRLVQEQGGWRYRPFTEEDYGAVVEQMADDGAPWGQLIWYRRRGHLHVSNPRDLVYSDAFIGALGLPDRRQTYVQDD